jgi:hypothetical protein
LLLPAATRQWAQLPQLTALVLLPAAAALAGEAMAVDNTNFKGCWRPEEDEALRK